MHTHIPQDEQKHPYLDDKLWILVARMLLGTDKVAVLPKMS